MAGSYNAGIVTAYGAAVRGGYTGTYEQFCAQQANYAQTAAAVEQAKQDAQAAAQRAQDVADSIPEDYTELTEEVGNLKDDFDNTKNGNVATDNLFSNYRDEWKQGAPSGSESYISSVITAYEVDLTKNLYFWSKGLNGFTGALCIYWFDDDMTYLSNRTVNVGLARSYTMMSIVPTGGKYFKVGLNSGNGSVSVTPTSVFTQVVAYIGYSAVENEEAYYARHIPKWAAQAMVEREEVATDLIDKIGKFDLSQNLFSNYAKDWQQGENDTSTYRSTIKKTFPVLKGLFRLYVEKASVPDELLTSGSVYIRVKNSSNSTLVTFEQKFSTASNVREADILASYPTASYITISVSSGSGSVIASPERVSLINAYVGWKSIGSQITTKYDCDNRNIPQYSRQVVDGGYLPDYWLNYLHDKAITIDQIDESVGGHGISIAFVTDQHWNSNFQKSPLILKWLKNHVHIDRYVGGGDVLTNHNSIETAMQWIRDWKNKTNGLKMRNLRGNHDNNSVGVNQQYWIGDGRFYSALIRPCEDSVIVEDGHLYYYEKIDAQKVAIFYLDTGDLMTAGLIDFDAQISWMDSIVQTLSSDWSILVMQHVIYDGVDGNNIPIIATFGTKIKAYLDTVTNCNVIGVIGGHMHMDYSEVTANGYPLIVTTCDASGGQILAGQPAHTEGTTTEQVIDVFHIDTDSRKIYATRIGCGSDRNWDY